MLRPELQGLQREHPSETVKCGGWLVAGIVKTSGTALRFTTSFSIAADRAAGIMAGWNLRDTLSLIVAILIPLSGGFLGATQTASQIKGW